MFDVRRRFVDRKILAGAASSLHGILRDRPVAAEELPARRAHDLTLNLSPRAEQLWAFRRGTKGFARLTFDPLQPSSLYAEAAIDFVHDFATELGEAERSALALHILPNQGHFSVAATLFDGNAPSTAHTRFYSELELTGIK